MSRGTGGGIRLGRVLALACVLLALPAAAQTRRLALVVGHNVGDASRPALRYAESDAAKVARVLVELGQVATGDVWLLQGRGAADVERAVKAVRAQVEAQRRVLGRTVLYFYFSGHSDGEALELGRERLSYATLRAMLAGTTAEVRLLLIDACKSGAGVLDKGGRPAASFDVRLHDELYASGEALLTSSAGDELSLESSEMGGGVFTTHLVSGLRGAADGSGDGRVTLGELYRYAYARTVSATAASASGPQHPVYDMRLSGKGELVLSQVSLATSRLQLPRGTERALVRDVGSDALLAELSSGGGPSGGGVQEVALPAGTYALTLVRGGERFAGRVSLAEGERRAVRWDELAPLAATVASARGGELHPWVEARQVGVVVSLGYKHPTIGPTLRLGLERTWTSDWVAAVSVGTGQDRYSLTVPVPEGFESRTIVYHDTRVYVRGGYRWVWQHDMLALWAGVEAGAGLSFIPDYFQDPMLGSLQGMLIVTPSFIVGPRLGFQLELSRSLRLGAYAEGLLGLPFDDTTMSIGLETSLRF